MTVNWRSEFTLKDVLQVIVLIVTVTIMVTTMRASVDANTRTIIELKLISGQLTDRVFVLERAEAARSAYERGLAEGRSEK